MANKGGFIGQDGLNAPDEPTSVSATAGDTQATVSFTAPSDVGGSAITGYRAQSNDGIGASGSSSPITVTGLTNGTSYTFNVWAINAFGYSAPSDASGSVSPAVTPYAIVFGGSTTTSISNRVNTIQRFDISSTGNASDFGDMTEAVSEQASCSSSTRGIAAGGVYSSGTDGIQYVTIATEGNGTDFGDLNQGTRTLAGLSNSTRGVFAGGNDGATILNNIQYITIASTGDALDFGDCSATLRGRGGLASSTRGIIAGGDGGSATGNTPVNTIEYITIASTGNSTDFGDLTVARSYNPRGCSSSTRGIFGGGSTSYQVGSNVMDYVTIASTGNATDFGNLTQSRWSGCATSSSTRGIFAGGFVSSTAQNRIDYVTIASTGNATDFGDMTASLGALSACSAAHGGLQ